MPRSLLDRFLGSESAANAADPGKMRRFREELRSAHLALTEMNARSRDIHQILARQEIDRLLASDRYADPRRLERHGYKAYSQSDEDGIIQEIFRRIGPGGRTFFETGVGFGLENNTVYLLHCGWRGAWVDASPKCAHWIRRDLAPALASGQLRFDEDRVSAENINDLLRRSGVGEELDLFSLDIDGNDWHVLKALTVARPRVMVIEYNAKFVPPVSWFMPYNPNHRWGTNDAYGTSLQALTDLAAEKGYKLVGCNLTGVNAFFVREDLVGEHFQPPFTAENFYQPARLHLILGMVSGFHATFTPSGTAGGTR